MSQHDDLFAASATGVLMQHLGETGRVTYTPPGGSPVSLTAIVGAEVAKEIIEKNGRTKKRFRPITISLDPASDWGGVASPQLRATLTVDTVSYAVESIDFAGEGLAVLIGSRPEPMEKSRDNYRRRPVGGE